MLFFLEKQYDIVYIVELCNNEVTILIGCYKFWVLFSYIGVMLSMLSIYFTANNNYKLAIMCFMFAGMVDMFDGKVASRFKRDEKQKHFGTEIDSIIDTVNFGMIPIIIFNGLGFSSWYDYILMFLYIFSVTMRLAYFNTYLIEQKENNEKYEIYIGFPVTSIALFLPFAYIFYRIFPNPMFMRLGILISSILFLSRIKIKRYKSLKFNLILLGIGISMLIWIMVG